jgi:ribosomal protein S17E
MGRIKSKMIKNAAKELLASNIVFSPDFNDNKKILANHLPSKPVRNKVAGYIARLVKMKNNPKAVRQSLPLEQ